MSQVDGGTPEVREFTTDTGVIAYEVLEPAQAEPVETVLLLHNFMSTGRMAWGPIALELRERYRVILPDLPGHGRSRGYPADFNHRAIAAQIAALLESEGASAPHVAGCSGGGIMALWLAHDGPVTPATLTLVSATYSINPETTGVQPSLRPESFQAGRSWLEATARLHDVHQGEGYFNRTLLPAFRRLTPESAIDLSPAALASLTMPACVIHGDQDEIFPVELARQLAEGLPNAELHIIPGQSHDLIFRRRWVVSERMRDFLARHPMRAASPKGI
ncbi:MAG TPA: alpha/beta hydrolase [Caldilineaceae bacterium]|nr:alpha/beta hydrolase [Caldilineaceae bacterium]